MTDFFFWASTRYSTGAGVCRGWPTNPAWWNYDPELRVPSAIPFSVDLRDTARALEQSTVCFAQLGMGCSNPPLILRVVSLGTKKI